jgi:hypothetical protein
VTALTPTYGFRYLTLSDPPDIPNLGKNLAEDVEAKLVTVDTAVAANTTELGIRKIIKRGRRITPSSTTTTIVGVMRLDNVALKAGREYTIRVTGLHLDSTVAADALRAEIRFDATGAAATTASNQLQDSIVYGRIVTANSGETKPCEAEVTPGADATYSFILCVARIAGAGNARLFAGANDSIHMKIYDCGTAVSDTAVIL